jgi:isopentenyl-diphosphate delta-isomerase
MEHVITVDRFDCELGTVEKLVAHQKGILHRAISICIFDSKGRLMIQKRATSKYHSGGLLANSCCSHPRPHEETADAATRRLKEELGIECPLHFCSSFLYKMKVSGGLIEHEFDHVYIGLHDSIGEYSREEAEDVFFMEEKEVEALLESSPNLFVPWFAFVFREAIKKKSVLQTPV